jgi:hypothetical protein
VIASDWMESSVVVGDQGALVGGADLPVPPDRRGQGQQPLGDPDPDPGQGAAAVAFQPKLVFEGVEGALDPLAPTLSRIAELPRCRSSKFPTAWHPMVG